MANLEQELKLLLDEREYDTLRGLTCAEGVLQENFHFTSKDLPEGTMVRLRKKQGYTLCCKQLISQGGGVTVCREREREVDDDVAESWIDNGISAAELWAIYGIQTQEGLSCAGSLATERVAFDYGKWRLELDKNQYLGVTDYELECESHSVRDLEELKASLAALNVEIRFSEAKSKRFADALKLRDKI